MFRAYAYLAAAGIIWLIEGFLFSYYLRFRAWQVALIVLLYVVLYGSVVRIFIRSLRRQDDRRDSSAWRAVALAPMLMVVVGSFASLPLIVAVAALGSVI